MLPVSLAYPRPRRDAMCFTLSPSLLLLWVDCNRPQHTHTVTTLWPAGQWYVGVAWTRKITDEQSTSAARLPSRAKNKHTVREREKERERWQAYILLITRCQPLTESAAPGPDPPARSARASPFSKAAGACRGVGAAGWRDGRANRLPLAVAVTVRRARAAAAFCRSGVRTEWAGMDSARCARWCASRVGRVVALSGVGLGAASHSAARMDKGSFQAWHLALARRHDMRRACAEHGMASNQPKHPIHRR